MSKNNELTNIGTNQSKGIGRPRTITEGDMYRMIELFRKGYSVALVCAKAQVPRSAFYAEMERNEEFRDKITASQDLMVNRAASIIVRELHRGNSKVAMWVLDRQDRRERNAQRAKEYRLIKQLTVSKSYTETQSVELEIDTMTD